LNWCALYTSVHRRSDRENWHMPVPKEQPPRKLSGARTCPITELWRDPDLVRGADGIAISGERTEGASWRDL